MKLFDKASKAIATELTRKDRFSDVIHYKWKKKGISRVAYAVESSNSGMYPVYEYSYKPMLFSPEGRVDVKLMKTFDDTDKAMSYIDETVN